jgi:hypothetical protein
MRIAILTNAPDLSSYLTEIFKAWGLPLVHTLPAGQADALDPNVYPVAILPAADNSPGEALAEYARRGGTAITFLPGESLCSSAGLTSMGVKETPLRLRVTRYPASGLAGELLPVVGTAANFRHEDSAKALAYLSHPGRFEDETVAITETELGSGRLICFAFDLPLCVLLLRQGDPRKSEFIPEGDACARPSHMASDVGPHDAGWIPFADLMSRMLVDLCRRFLPAPVPMISHLPGEAPGILLYSGDEDSAKVAWNDDELGCVTKHGGKMNLYIIPINTHSTPEDTERYSRHHHIGPHPNLRPLDGHPVQERLKEFERQIKLFEKMFATRSVSVRNHCTAWAGYLEPVEVMERLGVRMDANYFSGTYKSDREGAPYAAFGGALPLRFCQPDGRLYDVYQQHTHLTDDGMFGWDDYSFKISPKVFSLTLKRMFTDIAERFHTPYGVCIHPSNWVKFSGDQGRELLVQANSMGLPIWSFDQWVGFWDARDSWQIQNLTWTEQRLQFNLVGRTNHQELRFLLPNEFEDVVLLDVSLDGKQVLPHICSRYGKSVSLLALPDKTGSFEVCANYRS